MRSVIERRLPPGVEVRTSEVVVVGAGVAGMTAALGCAPRSVTILTKAPLGRAGSSAWAQGGIAAAVGLDDSPALHAADTLAASSGLSDREAVRVLTEEGPGRVAALIALGARFDRVDGVDDREEARGFGGDVSGPSRGRSSPAPALALGTSGGLLAPALRCARGSATADGTARAALAQGCLGGAPTGRTSLPGATGRLAGSTVAGGGSMVGLALGREAAHGRARILHAGGDATGLELSRALAAAVGRSPSVRVVAGAVAADLLLDFHGRVAGVLALHSGGRWVAHLAPAVVLATGGVGQLYGRTTNPAGVTADGLAMAARAGARVVDLELVQFHPTALAVGAGEAVALPLVTEAVRGEGAVLVDGGGRRFMVEEHPLAELAPRDVVARALYRRIAAGEPVFLDATAAVGERFAERFPTVFAACRRAGIDPRRQPIPVTPAAHYHMGGVETDLAGRTSLAGLWACGEAASTGAHGANRLASNSLLEGLVFGARVAADVRSRLAPVPAAGGAGLTVAGAAGAGSLAGSPAPVGRVRRRRDSAGRALVDLPGYEDAGGSRVAAIRRRLRAVAWSGLGVVRDGAGIAAAEAELDRLATGLAAAVSDGGRDAAAIETGNLLLAGRLVAAAARTREESRGAHFRSDFPAEEPAFDRRLRWVLGAGGEPVEVGEAGSAAGVDDRVRERLERLGARPAARDGSPAAAAMQAGR